MALSACFIAELCRTEGRYDPQTVAQYSLILLAEIARSNAVIELAGGGGGGGGLGTATDSIPPITHTASSQVLPATPLRKSGSFIQNNTDVDMWITTGATAAVGVGELLTPGSVEAVNYTNAIQGILAVAKTIGQVNVRQVV